MQLHRTGQPAKGNTAMAHNLYTDANGKTSMFSVREVPWHKLGTVLDNPATAEEAIAAAGLDFTVIKKPVEVKVNGHYEPIDGRFATVRTDTMKPLGVVGSRYEVVQNREAFNFFDALVGEGEAMYETAGVLGQGERVWIMAKLPSFIRVGKGDDIGKYLLLALSHDGSSPIIAKLTPIRVVCNNTLSMALRDSSTEVRIRHTANAGEQLKIAHKILGLTNQMYEQVNAIFNKMATVTISDKQLLEYCKTLIPDNEKAESNTRAENQRNTILELTHTGAGANLETAKGTLWGAYNAATEYSDHFKTYQGSAINKLESVWFGSGQSFKQHAFDAAVEIINQN